MIALVKLPPGALGPEPPAVKRSIDGSCVIDAAIDGGGDPGSHLVTAVV